MKYSLINVSVLHEEAGTVDGVWLQDHTGTLKTASKVARETEKANSNRIKIAVVESLNYCSPNFCFKKGLKKLA